MSRSVFFITVPICCVDTASGVRREPGTSWKSWRHVFSRGAGQRPQELLGFIWQGAPTEVLTCNALEWQESQGGGAIIDDGRITVDNPETVRAWERAARWVGSISPRGVLAYREWDTQNIWKAGDAASCAVGMVCRALTVWAPPKHRASMRKTMTSLRCRRQGGKRKHIRRARLCRVQVFGAGGSSGKAGPLFVPPRYRTQAPADLLRSFPRSLTCIKILAYEPRTPYLESVQKVYKKLLLHDLLQ